ncbi:MAG: phenylalanine--tRNA ligase subunit beta, partial [Desulfurivibrionaceae bacterium]
ELAPLAMERAVQLLGEVAGVDIVPGGIDIYQPTGTGEPLELRISKTREVLGLDFSADGLKSLLSSIEIESEDKDEDTLRVTPPSFRIDLEREVDLIEEIARLKGYNRFPQTLPVVPMSRALPDGARNFRREVAALAAGLGFDEAINYSFISPRHFDMLHLPEDSLLRKTISLQNPLTDDQSIMRTTLLPGLLENIRHNINHQTPDIRLFEIGKVFIPQPDRELPLETTRLTLLCSGARYPEAPSFYFSGQAVDFFDIKGVGEELVRELRRTRINFEVAADQAPAYCQPFLYMQLTESGRKVGELGGIHPDVLNRFSIKQDVFYLDVDLDLLYRIEPQARLFQPLSRYPAVKRDLAVLVPVRTGAGDIIQELLDNKDELIEDAELFDVYEGKPIQAGYKSVAISMTYRSADHTLSDKEVNNVHQQITERILERFEGRLREE